MIAVTGAAGFIGSVLVRALNDRGETDILVVDNLGSVGKFLNLRAKQFRKIATPARFAEQFAQGKRLPDTILHIGAITDTTDRDADRMLVENTRYTDGLAKLAMERGIRFIYASSASVYGDGSLGFSDADELTSKLLPLNPYAFSKWLFDNDAVREGWTGKIAGLRFFNVFGPNEYHKARMASVVWHAHRQLEESGRIALFQSHKEGVADGEQKRDFVYVKDVVRVILWFLDHPVANGIFNVGSGHARSFNDLANALFEAAGRPVKIEYVPTPENIRNSYQYYTQAELSKLRGAGCDVPFTPLEEAVRDYVQSHLTSANPYL